jgi:hypothetical protein
MLAATKPEVCPILNSVLPSFPPGALGELLASRIKRQALGGDPDMSCLRAICPSGLPLDEGGFINRLAQVLSLLERASFLRHTFLDYGSGLLEVDCAEVARDKGQVGR